MIINHVDAKTIFCDETIINLPLLPHSTVYGITIYWVNHPEIFVLYFKMKHPTLESEVAEYWVSVHNPEYFYYFYQSPELPIKWKEDMYEFSKAYWNRIIDAAKEDYCGINIDFPSNPPDYRKLPPVVDASVIYDKGLDITPFKCDTLKIPSCYDVRINAIVSAFNEYAIEVILGKNDQFLLSMERPIFLQIPSRNLSINEKNKITKACKEEWHTIISAIKTNCNDCCNQYGICYKYLNQKIPDLPPDYSQLQDYYN